MRRIKTKKYLKFAILMLSLTVASSQNINVEGAKDLNVLYRNEASVGIFLHSQGLGINFRRGFHVTAEKKRILELDFCTMRDPKEIKLSISDNSKGYYYGKLNSLFIVRPGVGRQIVFFRRGERKSVEIRYSTFIGASLCFAKPVYLDILHTSPFSQEPMPITTEQYDPEIHNQSNIYGQASFFTGINKTKIFPGGYGKFSLSCEFGEDYTDLKAIEIGMIADVYPYPVPLMAYNESNHYFLTLYASMVIGWKWF